MCPNSLPKLCCIQRAQKKQALQMKGKASAARNHRGLWALISPLVWSSFPGFGEGRGQVLHCTPKGLYVYPLSFR